RSEVIKLNDINSNNKVFYGKQFIDDVVDTIKTKDILQSFYRTRYILRATMSGFILGLITVFVLMIRASLDGQIAGGLINLIASICFSFALVLILFTNSELLTSNFMYFTVGLYYRITNTIIYMKIFSLFILGIILGGFILFVFFYLSDVMSPEIIIQLGKNICDKTLTSRSTAILVKGIFANFFINISLVIAMQIKE